MDEQGLWRLFFKTGMPEVYLLLKHVEKSQQAEATQAKTAFGSCQTESRHV